MNHTVYFETRKTRATLDYWGAIILAVLVTDMLGGVLSMVLAALALFHLYEYYKLARTHRAIDEVVEQHIMEQMEEQDDERE